MLSCKIFPWYGIEKETNMITWWYYLMCGFHSKNKLLYFTYSINRLNRKPKSKTKSVHRWNFIYVLWALFLDSIFSSDYCFWCSDLCRLLMMTATKLGKWLLAFSNGLKEPLPPRLASHCTTYYEHSKFYRMTECSLQSLIWRWSYLSGNITEEM